jgi:hypothetical protein
VPLAGRALAVLRFQIVLFFLPTAQSAHETLTLGRVNRFSLFPEYRIPAAIRNAHTHVIGRSGMGKSKFLEFMLYQDIASARGCGLIDPHSLLIDDLLRLLLTRNTLTDLQIRRKIIYVDPSRTDYVVPFNVLATEHDVYDKAASILEAFRRTWPDALREAPHFSNVVTAALLVLIQNKLTLMDMPRLLTNQEFREQCLQQVTDRSVIAHIRQFVFEELGINRCLEVGFVRHLKRLAKEFENQRKSPLVRAKQI